MKSIVKKYILPTVLAAGMFTACTSDFEEINNDPNRPTNEDLLADGNLINGFFPQLSRSVYFNFDNSNWKWQVQQNLNGDVFSGYMAPPTPFAGNANATHYNLIWNLWPWSLGYENIMSPANAIDQLGEDLTPRLYAPALVLKVLGMHRVTDIYGPIPYVKFGTSEVTYDGQEAVYDKFFAELDLAINNLGNTEPISTFSAVDDLYQGDFVMWKKLAASLKLRLAMRISNVNPSKAKQYAEEAIAAGVFEGADIASVGEGVSPIIHPLATISEGWGDIKMGADMESILSGLNDPRLGVYFTKAGGPEDGTPIKDGYAGVRSGIDLPEGRGDYQFYSRINTDFINQTTPIVLMTSAEVYFLRAEAALKGWNAGGTAQALYEEGVKQSFAQHGVSGDVDAYLMDDSSVPADYVDPSDGTYGTDYSTAAVSDVTIKFDSNKALEQIITQKWIAMFPEGMEAWSEFRRTGYPHIFPVKYNKSNGDVPAGDYIKRLRYPDGEAVNNVEAYNAGVSALKSENSKATGDTAGSSLWWDVD